MSAGTGGVILCNTPGVDLPGAWNQINWNAILSQVEALRGEAFACSKSGAGALVKLRDVQKRILDAPAPATLLSAIRRVTSKSARETAGVDELIVVRRYRRTIQTNGISLKISAPPYIYYI